MYWLLIIPPVLAGMFFVGLVLRVVLEREIAADIQRMNLPEDELKAELAKDGETIESARARVKEVLEIKQSLAVVDRLMGRLGKSPTPLADLAAHDPADRRRGEAARS
jgi:hypothetical protein